MTDEMTPRPVVMEFARLMERELREHEGKGGWKRYSLAYLYKQFMGEAAELGEALFSEKWNEEDAGSECADAANFLMMLCDVLGLLGEHGDRGRAIPR